MLINNKYTLWYNSIINLAKSQQRNKDNNIYFESHHIIPKCMGGTNGKENLVLLTGREHFICHLLLCKMVEYKSQEYFKLVNAILYFKGQNIKCNKNRYISSYMYEHYRIMSSKFKKENYNREKDIARRNKISASMKIVNANRDKSLFKTSEWKEKCSKNGKLAHTETRIYKYKNNPNPPEKIKKIVSYKDVYIEKNDMSKLIKANQVPQYEKCGWKRMVVPTGFEPV